MATLERIIRDNGGSARVFTTVDIMGKGIHYTRKTKGSYISLPVPALGGRVRSHVDIDLNDANSQELLRKIVTLTLSYTPPSGSAGYRKYGFVLSSLSTGEPICLLNGDRFLNVEEIYSIDYKLTRHDIFYDNIDISKFSGVFDIEGANKDWQKYNTYYPYDLSKDSLDLF